MTWWRSEVKSAPWHCVWRILIPKLLIWQSYSFMNLPRRYIYTCISPISHRLKNSHFFVQGNALYNVLPDIISHLSDPSTKSTENQASFQNIVKWVIELPYCYVHLHSVLHHIMLLVSSQFVSISSDFCLGSFRRIVCVKALWRSYATVSEQLGAQIKTMT